MIFDKYLRRWNLTLDGEAIHTSCSDLLPVLYEGQRAMLKIARIDEERIGNRLMIWWNGDGAARVYQHDDAAQVMERVEGDLSLAAMALNGQDDEATRILCHAAEVLHRPRPQSWPDLPQLAPWFRALQQRAPLGGLFGTCWDTAQQLLADPIEVRPLHGDIHHGNVLHNRNTDGTRRDWLAIDPKGLIGERGFDFANLFCNPTLDFAQQPGRLARQSHLVAELAGLERGRLLRWIVAYAGLSAAWHLEGDGQEKAAQTLEIARLALAELRD